MAASIGDEKALEIYKRLLHTTRNEAITFTGNRYLFYDTEVNTLDEWSNKLFIKSTQVKGDLGQRMQAAFKAVLQMENKAVIIGSDCPQIKSRIIDEAMEKLDNADVVIGPTLDGGYYLLGMKKLHRDLFSNIPWSTDQVFTKTIERLQNNNLRFLILEELSDLDTKEDLDKFPHLL